jgi:DNA-binding Lrp family transcriptional regulator
MGVVDRTMAGSAPKLDRIDIRILSHLQTNGRVTNVDLADAVGLSASPCLMRVKRLEKSGYITGYGAHIQLQKLGDTLAVFTEVTLADHRSADFARFEASIRRVDEIVACYLVSGGYDYLLQFVTRNIQQYQEIVERLLELRIGIEKYFSYVVIRSVFVKHDYPLEKFFAPDD